MKIHTIENTKNNWLTITALNGSNGDTNTKTHLFRITDLQKETFLIFLNAIDKHNGYWPCGTKQVHSDTLDCKHLYPEVFNNEDVMFYLELIADYFPVLTTGFDFLTIDFQGERYGYNNN